MAGVGVAVEGWSGVVVSRLWAPKSKTAAATTCNLNSQATSHGHKAELAPGVPSFTR